MRDIQFPGRSVVMSTQGMVSTSQPMATQVGLEILKSGGNAMDAAIAASATLCVTEPFATGIGGDCFLLYHQASSGKLYGLNGSGRAPAGATLEAYTERGFTAVPEQGSLAVTVPGAVDAWETARQRFATREMSALLQPAIDYAEQGYVVSPVVAQVWKQCEAQLAATPGTRAQFLQQGKSPPAGSVHRQAALAKSLRLIAQQGRDAFYCGAIAEEIVNAMREQDGLMTLDDLAAHKSEWVEPISSDYRGVRLHQIPPNGVGLSSLMMLNIVENAKVSQLEPLGADRIHLFTEAFNLALAERDRFVADTDFHAIPLEGLLDKRFAATQYQQLDMQQATHWPLASIYRQHRDTVYLSVVDKDRNAVSFINSLYHPFGSCLVAGNSGIVLQNRAAGFVLQAGHFNCIAPRKRPKHTIIPAMAYTQDGSILCFGVMGGQFQAMGQAYVLSNWRDYGMDLQQAIDAPRFMSEQGELLVERGIPASVRDELRRRGHKVIETAIPHGGAQAILVDARRGVLQAGSDARKDGCALGY